MYFTRPENYSFKKGGFSFQFKKEVFYSRKHSIQLLCICNWPSKIQENAIKLRCLLPVSEREEWGISNHSHPTSSPSRSYRTKKQDHHSDNVKN